MTALEIVAPEKFCKTVQGYIKTRFPEMVCVFTVNTENNQAVLKRGDREKIFSLPVRIGDVIDHLILFQKSENKKRILKFGNAILDTHEFVFTSANGKATPLTEKECDILSYLNDHKGDIIPREQLLRAVWNYADDAETHTLETHIYRLRQKIEENPAQPKILKTAENGYYV